jgi:hypothetical protein
MAAYQSGTRVCNQNIEPAVWVISIPGMEQHCPGFIAQLCKIVGNGICVPGESQLVQLSRHGNRLQYNINRITAFMLSGFVPGSMK